MREFRKTLNGGEGDNGGFSCTSAGTETKPKEESRSKTLLDTFSEYLVGTKWGKNVQGYIDAYSQRETVEQIQLAEGELIQVKINFNF